MGPASCTCAPHGAFFSAMTFRTPSLQILCSEDNIEWHVAVELRRQEVKAESSLPCKKVPCPVKWFKLQVLDGELRTNRFCIQGVLQSDEWLSKL